MLLPPVPAYTNSGSSSGSTRGSRFASDSAKSNAQSAIWMGHSTDPSGTGRGPSETRRQSSRKPRAERVVQAGVLHVAKGAALLFWLTLVLTGTAGIAGAQGVQSAQFINLPSPGYVIDAERLDGDATTNRWRISIQATANLPQVNLVGNNQFRIDFTLLDDTGTPHALESGLFVSSPIQITSLPPPATATFSAELVPAAQLIAGKSYTLQAQLKQRRLNLITGVVSWEDVGAAGFSAPTSFVHFRGPFGADSAQNVIAVPRSSEWQRRLLFPAATSGLFNEFEAVISFDLHRFDEPQSPPTDRNDPVGGAADVEFSLELMDDATGSIIALAETVSVGRYKLASYVAGTRREPAVESAVPRTVRFRPLNPGAFNSTRPYLLRVRLRPPALAAASASVVTSPSQPLVRLSGGLVFGTGPGSVRATLQDLSVASSVGAATPVTAQLVLPSGSGLLPDGSTFGSPSEPLGVSLTPSGDAVVQTISGTGVLFPSGGVDGTLGGTRFVRSALRLTPAGARSDITITLPAGMGWSSSRTSKRINGLVAFPDIALDSNLNPAGSSFTFTTGSPIWMTTEQQPVSFQAESLSWTPVDASTGRSRFDLQPTASRTVAYVRWDETETRATFPGARPLRSNEGYHRFAEQLTSGSSLQVHVSPGGAALLTASWQLSRTVVSAGEQRIFRSHLPYDTRFEPLTGRIHVVKGQIGQDSAGGGQSHLALAVSARIVVAYSTACPTECTPGSAVASSLELVPGITTPGGAGLRITPDGGLHAGRSILPSPLQLQWGHQAALNRAAHRIEQHFAEAVLHIPGYFMEPADSSLSGTDEDTRNPCLIGYSGFLYDGSNLPAWERPGTPAYALGRAFYAGLNLRLDGAFSPADLAAGLGCQQSTATATSVIAGAVYGTYPLKRQSRYYLRPSGVSGVHEEFRSATTTPASLPSLYGYAFRLDAFGFALADSRLTDSLIKGQITTPRPTNLSLELERMQLDCSGDVTQAGLGNGASTATLSYWKAPIDLQHVRFQAQPPPSGSSSCSAAAQGQPRILALTVKAHSAHLPDALTGVLGVFPGGNLTTAAAGIPGLDSRLDLPAQVRIRGPEKTKEKLDGITDPAARFEYYTLTPATGAYFNNPVDAPGAGNRFDPPANFPASNSGFLNLAGNLRVAFFQTLPIHLHTESHRAPADPVGAPGAWGSAEIKVASGSWTVPGTSGAAVSSFATSASFDAWNRGHPYPTSVGGTGEDAATYTRSTEEGKFLPVAKREWLGGALVLKYRLKWDTQARTFRSLDASKSKDSGDKDPTLIAGVEADHWLEYLSAEHCELRFGLKWDGFPRLNLANFVFNKIDDGLGNATTLLTDATLKPIFEQLDKGTDELAKVLKDELRTFLGTALRPVIDPVADSLYNTLDPLWDDTAKKWRPLNPGQPLIDGVDIQIVFDAAGKPTFTLKADPIAFLKSRPGVPSPLVDGLSSALLEAEIALGYLLGDEQALRTLLTANNRPVPVIPGTTQVPVLFNYNPASDNVGTEIAVQLAMRLLGEAVSRVPDDGLLAKLKQLYGQNSPQVATELRKLLDKHLAKANPTFKAVARTLHDARETIRSLRSGTLTTDLGAHLDKLMEKIDQAPPGSPAGTQTEGQKLRGKVGAELSALLAKFDASRRWDDFTREQIRDQIRNILLDKLVELAALAKAQEAIKQRLDEVEKDIRKQVDAAFARIGDALKDVLREGLSEIDDKVNALVSDKVRSAIGAGSLDGYATFNGDSLRKIRLDGKFAFSVPDELKFSAALEVNHYTSSDKPPGCATVPEGGSLTEVTIEAKDIGGKVPIAKDASVVCSFLFKVSMEYQPNRPALGPLPLPDLMPVGLGGQFAVKGDIKFEAVTIKDFKVGFYIGKDQAYLFARVGMSIKSFSGAGAVFFGRTCTLEPIRQVDPLVAKVLPAPAPTFTGGYVYAEVTVPVLPTFCGIPDSCMVRVTATVGAGFFYFTEGPTFGARLALGVDGEVLCLLTVKGRIDLAGVKQQELMRLIGEGQVEANLKPLGGVKKKVTMSATIKPDGKMDGKVDLSDPKPGA